MNESILPQLFWCELQGYKVVLTAINFTTTPARHPRPATAVSCCISAEPQATPEPTLLWHLAGPHAPVEMADLWPHDWEVVTGVIM